MTSLLKIHKERFLDAIRSDLGNQFRVIVVDNYCKALIEQVWHEHEILNEENVAEIALIENENRSKYKYDAIYIVQPTPENVKWIVCDFIDPQNKRYGGARINFIAGANDRLIDELTRGPIRPLLKEMKELYLDFNPAESMVFTTTSAEEPRSKSSIRTSDSFQILYNPSCQQLIDRELTSIARKIVSICASLGENPLIRFHRPLDNPHPARSHSTRLAQILQRELDDYVQDTPDFPPSTTRPRAILLITERGYDVMTPLLHEFTYQAMAYDLVDTKDGKSFSYEFTGPNGQERKDARFEEEKDSMYTQIRHMHMKDTLEKLMGDFNKFCQDNILFKDQSRAASLNDMRDMMAALPEFTETRSQFALHINIAEKCMEIFKNKELTELGLIEQDCATGTTGEGKYPKQLLDKMVPILKHPKLSPTDRMRLIMIYLLFKDGIWEQDLKFLLQHTDLYQRGYDLPLRNLDCLIPFRIYQTQDEYKAALKASRSRRRPKTNQSDEEAYELSRYVPPLKNVLEELINGTLDTQIWPYTVEQPPEAQPTGQQGSLRTQRPQWAKGSKSTLTDQKQRILVFIAGGATYSETRSCYEISKKWNRDVILGTTDLFTPESFVRELSRLRQSRQGLGLHLDTARERKQPRPPQPVSPPPQQSGIPAHPSQGRAPVPESMRPGSRNGPGGPRPPPGQARSSPKHVAHIPGHGVSPQEEKKKKKFGIF